MRPASCALALVLLCTLPFAASCVATTCPETLSPCRATGQKPPLARPAPPATQAELVARLNSLLNDADLESQAAQAEQGLLLAALNAPEPVQNLSQDCLNLLAILRKLDTSTLRTTARRSETLRAEENALAQRPELREKEWTPAQVRIRRRMSRLAYEASVPGREPAIILLTTRRLKAGSVLTGLALADAGQERFAQAQAATPHSAEIHEEDLAEETPPATGATPGAYVLLAPAEAQRRRAARAPLEREQRALAEERARLEKQRAAAWSDVNSLRDQANALLARLLLGPAEAPDPGRFTRTGKRLRRHDGERLRLDFAYPVTGQAALDAELERFAASWQAAYSQGRAQILGPRPAKKREKARRPCPACAEVVTGAYTLSTSAPQSLSILFELGHDTGGAHEQQSLRSFVFDLHSQRLLGLEDLFVDASAALPVLAELAARRLAERFGRVPFPEGLAPKPENFRCFTLDRSSLVLHFPPYQVASFADGAQAVRLPLTHPRLLPLLKH